MTTGGQIPIEKHYCSFEDLLSVRSFLSTILPDKSLLVRSLSSYPPIRYQLLAIPLKNPQCNHLLLIPYQINVNYSSCNFILLPLFETAFKDT